MPELRHIIFALLAIVGIGSGALANEERQAAALRAAFEAMRASDWDAAIERAKDAGAIGADIIEWHRLRKSMGRFAEYEAFLTPEKSLLRKGSCCFSKAPMFRPSCATLPRASTVGGIFLCQA